jgi:AraC-like DNA-binding protein
VSGLRALGHDPGPILAAAGVPQAALDDPDARVPMTAGVAVLRRASEVTGDSDIGLHLAERTELGAVDVLFYAMATSPTLGAAYQRLCRYQRLIHETSTVALEVDGDRATLRHALPGGIAVPRHSAEFIVAAWVRGGRVVTETDWAPIEVRFAHAAPADLREHARFFRAPVRFGMAENALILPTPLLGTPCVRADAALLSVLDRYAADRLESVPRSPTLAERARTALAEELRGSDASAPRLAQRLKMSVRTLNRALAAEGTSYRALLEQLRRELSTRYLVDGRLSIGEIAFLLGFSELSAFYRVFKRWTGETPAEFRRRRLAR